MSALTGSGKTLTRKGGGSRQEKHVPTCRLPQITLKKRLAGLVVDSDRTCRMFHEGLLVHFGVKTLAVGTGIDALNLFSSGSHFDVVIVDMFLPRINGLEIRGMGACSKIIGYTAYGEENERLAFLGAGADEFFGKPLEPEQLARILTDLDQ